MNLLALDTSTRRGSVALADGERVLLETVWEATGGAHTAQLLPMVKGSLEQVGWTHADLEGIAVTLGPGSFTGVRVGMATAAGIAFAHDLPIAGVSSLQALAANVVVPGRLVVPMLDARKREVYAAAFRSGASGPERLVEDTVSDPGAFLTAHLAGTEPVTLLGEGAAVYRDVVEAILGERAQVVEGSQAFVRAGNVAVLGARALAAGQGLEPSALRPEYLRRPEALVQEDARKKS